MGRYRTPGLFVLLAAVWGSAFVATDVGLLDLPPLLFAAVRFDVAAVVLFAYVWLTGADWRPETREDYWYVAAGGTLAIGAHHAFLFAGQQYVTGAVAAVLLGLIPVVTPALTRLFSPDERLTRRTAVGVASGFLGVVVIANPDPANLAASALGVALVLGAALAFALGAVATHARSPSLPLVATQAWMMAVGAAVLHGASLAAPGDQLAAATWTPRALLAVAYLSVVAGAAGFLLYFRLLAELGPIEASFLEYVIPVFAAVVGWLVLGQSVTLRTAAGFAAILAGFLVAKWPAVRTELRHLADGRRASP
ncbi:MAG: DMT family transporter [Halobacterium sp.]